MQNITQYHKTASVIINIQKSNSYGSDVYTTRRLQLLGQDPAAELSPVPGGRWWGADQQDPRHGTWHVWWSRKMGAPNHER